MAESDLVGGVTTRGEKTSILSVSKAGKQTAELFQGKGVPGGHDRVVTRSSVQTLLAQSCEDCVDVGLLIDLSLRWRLCHVMRHE